MYFAIAKSALEIEELLSRMRNKKIPATLLNENCAECEKQLEAAYELAINAFEQKANVSQDLQMEFLMWLSASAHAHTAIEKCGAKNRQRFVFAYFGKENGEKIAKENAINIIEKIPKRMDESRLKKIIEEMAISRI
ncbi:MAG: KEOPS complex subunit Cgi121 [Candidatus Micrarchaeia archaeon]